MHATRARDDSPGPGDGSLIAENALERQGDLVPLTCGDRRDETLAYYLQTERHIAIHGDSKQGKSWLRNKLLDSTDTIVVQCQVDTTPESLFREALGTLDVSAEIRRVGRAQLEGRLDFGGAGELGNILFGKVQVNLEGGEVESQEDELETQPIGQTPADLSWVARTFAASGKRLVIEDFHYVSEENRKEFAFLLKALGDYGVNVIVVGVWPEDHLLTYYNGDLDGRVEDIRLSWEADELREVLLKGCGALNIEMTAELLSEIVEDAYGNVGLVQRLAENVCLAAGIFETQTDTAQIAVGGELIRARQTVSAGMQARYDAFADNFVRGMKRMTEGLEVYKHMLRAFTAGDSTELLEGIDSRELLRRIEAEAPDAKIRQSDLTQALDRVDRLQAKISIQPVVLSYNGDRRRLFLADRSFLFYRKYGSPTWPWEKDETLNFAMRTPVADGQLDLDAEMPLTARALEEIAEAEAEGEAETETEA